MREHIPQSELQKREEQKRLMKEILEYQIALFLLINSNQLNEKKRKIEEEKQRENEYNKREEERIKKEIEQLNNFHEKYSILDKD
jgi:hypothetical protein